MKITCMPLGPDGHDNPEALEFWGMEATWGHVAEMSLSPYTPQIQAMRDISNTDEARFANPFDDEIPLKASTCNAYSIIRRALPVHFTPRVRDKACARSGVVADVGSAMCRSSWCATPSSTRFGPHASNRVVCAVSSWYMCDYARMARQR